jgi:hypothetical protein
MILKLLVGSVQSACQGWLVERKEGWVGAGVGEKVDKEKNFPVHFLLPSQPNASIGKFLFLGNLQFMKRV